LGVAAAVLVLVAAVTGFLLQHPGWLGPAGGDPLSVAVVGDQWFRGTAWGVERSGDGGRTWQEVAMLAPPVEVIRVVAAPDDPERIYALGKGALVRSLDGGKVWEDVFIDIPGSEKYADYRDLAVTGAGGLGLLTDRGLLGSLDGGATWVWLTPPDRSGGRNWHQWLHDLHTGRLFGNPGKLLVEGGAVALILLTVTGLLISTRRVNGRRR
jgi:photosystem II stability/assembly factor-like uncharacterized protein